jgi:polyhydroxyalkanoate synthesis regulator phasin
MQMFRMTRCGIILVFIASIFSFSVISSAAQVDALVDKLVEKGILTRSEANLIVMETEQEARKEIAQGVQSSLPDWIQDMKWSGDLRLRYEGSETDTGSNKYRHRGRVRFRYGFTTEVNDRMSVGFRMASGSADPTSANQTFTDNFSSKSLWVDRAYLKYSFPGKTAELLGGKIPNPFYRVGDLVWNGDINPEGAALKFGLPAGSIDYFGNIAFLPMYESSSNYDNPFLFGAQIGLGGDIAEKPFKLSAAYFDFYNLKGKQEASISSNYTPGTNSLTGGVYDYDYKVVNLNAELTPFTFDLGYPADLKLFTGYICNTASGVSEDTGYLAGFSLGKDKNPGEWKLGYTYYRIEKDAIAAIINSSDFETNRKGHKLGISYALLENTTLGLNYYTMKQLTDGKKDIDKWQVNLQVKF